MTKARTATSENRLLHWLAAQGLLPFASPSLLRKKRCRWPVCAALLLISLNAFAETANEYDVKAVCLLNFTKFIDWPHSSESSTFAICVLGEDPFGPVLDGIVKGKVTDGQPLSIRRMKEVADVKTCRMVFVGRDEKVRTSKLIDAVRGTPILTVSDGNDFLRMGGIIRISMKDDHVAVAINPALAERAGLKISARLMTLATLYKDDWQK